VANDICQAHCLVPATSSTRVCTIHSLLQRHPVTYRVISAGPYLEEVLYAHGVDLVLNGHVHSYERSHPVRGWGVDPCGTVHLAGGLFTNH